MSRFDHVLLEAAKKLKIPVISLQMVVHQFLIEEVFDCSNKLLSMIIWKIIYMGRFLRIKNNKHFIKCPSIELKNFKN